jgi:sigma-B regulation protein RsbU (phosphoserine phosphatase)
MWFVDDDPEFLRGVKWWFRPEKQDEWEFQCFSKGKDALQVIEAVGTVRPDVVVVDLNLSEDSFDGIFLIGRFAALVPASTLVALTADPFYEGSAEDSIKAGAVQFLKKDLEKREFWSRVEQAIWIKQQVIRAVKAEEAKARAEREGAREVQNALLPIDTPRIVGLKVQHGFWSADTVSGDHFGYQAVGEEGLLVAIGDVCGHGNMEVALVALTVGGCFRALGHVGGEILNPGAILQNINRAIISTSLERFMTLLVARIDASTRWLTYSTAGHPVPIVFRANEVIKLRDSKGGVPINVSGESQYSNSMVQLERGDFVLFYTDGVSEALVRADVGEGDQEERVIGVAKELLPDRNDFPNRLMTEIMRLCGPVAEEDDRTIIAMEVE